ncbi:39S ribosomal protein L21, mitochondrial, partial [Asbolus verrucosus]
MTKLYSSVPTPYEIIDAQEDRKAYQEIVNNVNKQISENKQGRLFAVVHVAGKQFKITEGDVVVVEGYWPPDAGDRISLDKILLVGAADFTLIGRPLIQRVYRIPQTLLRVNKIAISGEVNHPPDVTGLETRIF